MDINGVALMVGAGSGIGREVALTLASRGANPLVCVDINLEAAKQTANMSQSRKAPHVTDYKVYALQVDVRDEKGIQQMVDETKSLFGRIDYFLNAAGLGASDQKPISSMTLEDYRSLDEIHNIRSFLYVRTVLQTMLQQEAQPMPVVGRPPVSSPRHMSRGSIVILTSLTSEGTFLGVGKYITAKHAVKWLVQTAAVENARKSISVNAVAPAFVSGRMMNKSLDRPPALKATMLGDLAMGRFVDPEEVADAVAFLVSASASYTNGYTLTVDRGASLQLANTPFSG